MRQRFSIEFGMKKGSVRSLWKLISTPNGLSEWMADKVDDNKGVFSFHWGKVEERAALVASVPEQRIRFHWLHEPDNTYFELEIINSELTGEISLMLTDFAEPDDIEDLSNLWSTEIERLTRRAGL